MPRVVRIDLEGRAHELRERAATLARPLHAAANAATTVACERAMLRLFGVAGIDGAGRPLALEVTDRFARLGPARLGGGIALPFAAAAREYALGPQELSLEIASGHIDLGLEADLLREPPNRAAAEALVSEWMAAAWQRFDANRVARSELRAILGEAAQTVIGLDLPDLTAGQAAERGRELVAAGAGLVRVRVPRDRELRRGLGEELDPADAAAAPRAAPAGRQRGLALLRTAIDEAAAASGHYVRLGSASLGLAAPDQAVVAGFERVDLVCSDPLESIVEFGVQPSRAFADHAFALQIHGRSGAQLAVGAGPLAVAPELARGEPVDPGTRSGRALALQALTVELSRLGPLPPERILLGALPREAQALGGSSPVAMTEVALRRLVFPEHPLLIEEVSGHPAGWAAALAASITGGMAPAMVLRPAPLEGAATAAVAETRAALEAAVWLADGRAVGPLRGRALEHAEAALKAAIATLRALSHDGWGWLLSGVPSPGRGTHEEPETDAWFGAPGPVPRRDAFDPFAIPSGGAPGR
ncbi:MAG: lysine 5,6-aminomutase subunit alpha TIM-barrel domain-containing protein [Candidatus Limnocylindrales bacterium]